MYENKNIAESIASNLMYEFAQREKHVEIISTPFGDAYITDDGMIYNAFAIGLIIK